MVSTEEVYVASLESLVKHYQAPFRDELGLKSDEMTSIFSNLDPILQCQLNFLQDLRARWARLPDLQLGQVFIDFAPYFRMYTACACRRCVLPAAGCDRHPSCLLV
eukprot:SAG22_NODE_1186_length_5219_cov_345.307227_5_plen_106_part_00